MLLQKCVSFQSERQNLIISIGSWLDWEKRLLRTRFFNLITISKRQSITNRFFLLTLLIKWTSESWKTRPGLCKYLGCIHTCLVWFDWNKLKFVYPLGADLLGRCEYSNRTRVRTKPPHRDPAEEVVSVRFQTNSGTVRLMCEYEPVSIWPNCKNHAPKHTAHAYSAVVCISIA